MKKKTEKDPQIPTLELPVEIHNVFARLCNNSENEEKYPNIPTFMNTYREIFVLSMSLAVINDNSPNETYAEDQNNRSRTVPDSAIHSQWDTIIKAICYWWESKENRDDTHKVLTDPNKMKKIAEGFAQAGFEYIEVLLKPNAFRTNMIDILNNVINPA